MNYTYDIIVNLNTELYDFFEWNKSDDIEHIRKIPSYFINTNVLQELINSEVVFSKTFLNKLKNKTEIFTPNGISIIEYCALFCDNNTSVVLEFDKSGEIIRKSALLLDEEEDVINSLENNEIELDYEVVKKNNSNNFNTRYEKEIIKYINQELDLLYNNDNINKLKFLYNEWFNMVENDIKLIYKKLKSIFKLSISNKHIELYKLIKLSNKERI